MKKTKKRVLTVSLLSLLACGLMFAGTTYAWYSDNVTVDQNQVQAGSLKADLLKLDRESGNYVSLRDDATLNLFNTSNWEPGHTTLTTLRVDNKGTLGFSYQLTGRIVSETKGPNNESLADVIDVYVKTTDQVPSTFADVSAECEAHKSDANPTFGEYWTNIGTVKDWLNPDNPILSGDLLPSTSVTLSVVLHMKDEAGNVYQLTSIDNFEIELNAVQFTDDEIELA